MKNRFTHTSKTDRSRIRKKLRSMVFQRDNYTCQFCLETFDKSELTIDHLVPLAKGGIDEVTNYVSCCFPCNQDKADKPLHEFAATIGIDVQALPVHGDPVIDNHDLPIQIRLIRKRVFDKSRSGGKAISGKSAQKKLEKNYRRAFWETTEGKELESEFPNLPGQVRVIIPEIRTLVKDEVSALLLLELAKSAITRNLIGSTLSKNMDVIKVVEDMKENSNNEKLKKRLQQAWSRYEKELARRKLSNSENT